MADGASGWFYRNTVEKGGHQLAVCGSGLCFDSNAAIFQAKRRFAYLEIGCIFYKAIVKLGNMSQYRKNC